MARQPELEVASVWLRLCSAVVDVSVVAGMAVIVNVLLPWQSGRASVSLADVLMILIEVASGTSVGKVVVGLEVVWTQESLLRRLARAVPKYLLVGLSFLPVLFNRRRHALHDMMGGSTVLKRPASARVLRALAAVGLSLYVVATFGVGRLVGRLVDERITADRIDVVPTPLDAAHSVVVPSDWEEVWYEGLRLRVPHSFQGTPIQSGPVGFLLGGGRGRVPSGSYVMFFFGDDNHPFTQCSAPGPAWRHIVACGDPQTAQRTALAIRLADRRYLTPYGMLVTNARLVLKEQLVKGSPGRFFLRTHDAGGLLAHWIGRQRLPEKAGERVVAHDDVLFSTMTSRAGLSVLWRTEGPDDALLETIIRSAVLRVPTPQEVDAQVASSERSGDALGALNAMRAGHHERHILEVAIAALSKTGATWERGLYASWVEGLAKKDQSLVHLAEQARAWLPPKPPAGK